MICPICKTEQQESTSCINCGVIFSKIEEISKKKSEKVIPLSTSSEEEKLKNEGIISSSSEEESLWNEILQEPENRELHKRYVGYCLKNNLLSHSIKRYSQAIRERGREKIFVEFQQQLISVIQFSNLSSKRERRSKLEIKEESQKRALGCFAIGVSAFSIIVGTLFKSRGMFIFTLLRYIGFIILLTVIIFYGYSLVKGYKKLKDKGLLK